MEDRNISSFDISIATGLALESLLDPTGKRYDDARVIPNKVDLSAYNEVWFNLHTLARNAISSYQGNAAMGISGKQVTEILNYEVEVIKTIINTTYPNIKTVFYTSEYKHVLTTRHPIVRLRLPTTERQLHLDKIRHKGVDEYIKFHDDISTFSSELLTSSSSKAIILTSFPVDLNEYRRFSQLDLLESTTGVLKPRHLWYTKYYKGNELTMLPFYHKLLKLFGDNVHYHPVDFKIRNQLIELAKESQWNPLTTMDKVLMDVESRMKDRYFAAVFKLI